MKNRTQPATGCLLALTCLLALCTAPRATAQEKVTSEEARAIAKEAYTFNYPLVMYYSTRYLQAIDETSKSYSGGFGKWLHLGTSSPKDTDIVSPNNVADGSITINFQAKSPGKDKESNWLPAPEGPFWPILRTYGPGKTVIDKTYKLPAIRQVK